MNPINKQKFLAELGKLLTFMYDEDRQTALNMYAELFDNNEETEELAKLLVSPTRQAVVIARAYDPAQSEEAEEYGEDPDYIIAIKDAIGEVERKLKGRQKVSDDQFTFFQGAAEKDSTDSFIDGMNIDGIDENGEISYGTVGDGRGGAEYAENTADSRAANTKLSAGRLILFLIIAIPLGLAAIALMIALAALMVGIALAAGFLGFYAISAAFNSGFDIIADILVVGGLSVVLAAIGLLALWTGVWFLIGAVPGIVRGIVELGGKLCRREVAA